MNLKALNAGSLLQKDNKPVSKLIELERDFPYRIVEAKLINTKFSENILRELEENVVFLSKRCTETYKLFLQYFKNFNIFEEQKTTTPAVFGNSFRNGEILKYQQSTAWRVLERLNIFYSKIVPLEK